MSFLSPGFLWGLFALLPLLAIYFLKVRPRRKKTNAFFLWEKIFQEKRASSLFRRLRDVLSLLILILVILAIVAAMARPKLDEDDGRDLLIVVDVSASMLAGEKDGRGIAEAKMEAEQIVLAMNGTRRAALATLADRLEFVSHLSDSPKDLLEAVRGLQAVPVGVSEEARRVLNSYASETNGRHRVLLITDGHGGLKDLNPRVEVLRLGSRKKNAGLVAADLAWLPGKPKTLEFFYQITSSFEGPKQAELELRSPAGTIVRLIPLTLEEGLREPEVIEIDRASAGPWVAHLHIEDEFAEDDRVEMVLEERRRLHVGVQASESYFFRRCVESFDKSGGILTLADGVSADVVVALGDAGDQDATLVFAPAGESPYWQELGEEIDVLAAEILREGHPVLRHLDLDGLSFKGARNLQAPEGSLILAESEGGIPLLYKVQREGRSVVVVNLDPAKGDFFLSPWFPVLVYDAALHLGSRDERWRSVYATGTQLTIPAGAHLEEPDGSTATSELIALRKQGKYALSTDAGVVGFGAALLNPEESLLNGSGPTNSAEPVSKGYPPSTWLLIVALVLLGTEAWLYHRRKVG